MIYSLRKKLIWICGASITAVFVIIFVLICAFAANQLDSAMDGITDMISENGGTLPDFKEEPPIPAEKEAFPDFFPKESRLNVSFFTVYFDPDGEASRANMDFASSVPAETAQEYAEEALSGGKERGWLEGYRYKVYDTDSGQSVVFADGNMNRMVSGMILLSVGGVLIGSLVVILVLIVVFSKRAVRPIAESYEKQKQFITDANHELKTPLTLIMANLDILQAELGENEWLEDIRAEGERMNALVRQLVALTQMDEDGNQIPVEPFPISETISDVASEFKALAEKKGLSLYTYIQQDIEYVGNEASIRRLVSILLDNAVKYCDPAGEIRLMLSRKRKLVITVENSCADVGKMELDRLFDRFYRADKARSYDGGFGIGLSIAKAVAHRHGGDISAYRKEDRYIGIKVTLKQQLNEGIK